MCARAIAPTRFCSVAASSLDAVRACRTLLYQALDQREDVADAVIQLAHQQGLPLAVAAQDAQVALLSLRRQQALDAHAQHFGQLDLQRRPGLAMQPHRFAPGREAAARRQVAAFVVQ
ncbi:MAG: hypothetical protein IPI47_17655 [Piscinibacter sp.]|nr:hypothetical protein [Piscinibacter sp.]MBK7532365.1 hypothetical protein [Piscinibacter sp.]